MHIRAGFIPDGGWALKPPDVEEMCATKLDWAGTHDPLPPEQPLVALVTVEVTDTMAVARGRAFVGRLKGMLPALMRLESAFATLPRR